MAQYMAPATISDETTKDTAVSDRRGDIVFGLVARMAGWLILLVMAGIIIVLVAGGWRALANFGPQFFTSTAWDPVTQHFGAATSIFGTLVTTLVALVFAVPFAFGVAFWLVEMAPPALARVIETAVQLLAARTRDQAYAGSCAGGRAAVQWRALWHRAADGWGRAGADGHAVHLFGDE